jgi:hypothetical protein
MKRITNFLLIIILLLTSCASTISTTGKLNLETKINTIDIVCITPQRIVKFSNNLCDQLKNKLTSTGLTINTYVSDEMTPALTDSSDLKNSDPADLTLKITHLRISLINGMPCATLMNIDMFQKANMAKPIWRARIQTNGTNITGPGNPDKISMEIINQMKLDGFKL